MTEQDIERHSQMVKGAVRNVNDYDARMIAIFCLKAKEDGENSSIWHHSTIWFHNGDTSKCPCVPCSKARTAR